MMLNIPNGYVPGKSRGQYESIIGAELDRTDVGIMWQFKQIAPILPVF